MCKLAAAAITLSMLIGGTFTASAQEYQRGYMKRDGTYVAPHFKSSPDSRYNNNWGVRGNSNPYTGESGTKSPTWNDWTPSYNPKTFGAPGYNPGYGSDRSRY